MCIRKVPFSISEPQYQLTSTQKLLYQLIKYCCLDTEYGNACLCLYIIMEAIIFSVPKILTEVQYKACFSKQNSTASIHEHFSCSLKGTLFVTPCDIIAVYLVSIN